MDATVSELLSAFMDSPLVLWVRSLGPLGSCDGVSLEEPVSMFMELVDGVFLHKILTHIDPSPTNQRLNKNVNNDMSLRLHNLTVLTRHIKTYYQETLQQLIVMPLPNILCIAKDPLSAKSMEELRRLLLLLLGCAVQCERKQEMIDKIKLLDIQTQAAIVSHIQEVTHNQMNVLDLSWLEEGAELGPEELQPLSRTMAASLQQLIEQRDKATEIIVDLTQERDYLSSQQPQDGHRSNAERGLHAGGVGTTSGGSGGSELITEEKQHLSVELADAKAKLRRYRQDLEEKTEQLMDSKHEAERLDQELQRLKQENQLLAGEARSMRAYRDEVDSLRERAARVDRLEVELGRCKEKLHDVHFYRSRVEELREDNMTLLETKVLLEEQLASSRERCDKLHTLEKDNLLLQAKINDLEMERDNERHRLEELLEENMLLEIGQKQSMTESAHLGWELEQLSKNHDHSDTETRKSLVQELNECVSSRMLKLEKENRELQASIERLKEENHVLQEQQLHMQKLDREKQSLNNKLERLQGLLDQERLTNQDMESLGEELLKEKQSLEREMHALRVEKDQQILELESEKQHLSEAVASLQERAQSNSETRVREVETENRLLHQSITDTSSRLTSLETQLKVVSEEADRLRELAGRCEEAEREMCRLERSREALSREVESLHGCSEHSEALEKQVTSLEQEVHRLKREAEMAQEELQQQQSKQLAGNSQLSKENLELRCSLENLRSTASLLPTLQEELKKAHAETQEAQKATEKAREEAQGERKRVERLEMNISSLNQDKHSLEEELERTKDERAELEEKIKETQSREEESRKEVHELKEELRRKEELEEERKKLQLDLEQSEKSRKLLEKESWRIRTALEDKEAELEEKASRLAVVMKECGTLRTDVDRLKASAAKTKELEKENKELQKQATIDKRTLATLREDLVSEKLNVQQKNVELEKLNEELEKIGLNREKLLQDELLQDDSRYRLLQSRLEETVQQTIKLKEEKLSSLEKKLEDSSRLIASLQGKLSTAQEALSSLGQQQGQEQNSLQRSGEDRDSTTELLRTKDHLIAVEKQNASLQTENSLVKEQLKQMENQNSSLNSQMAALQRHTSTLQEQNSALHTQTAKLQVENSTISSQSASLMAQNAVLQGQVSALETEVESWQRQREEAWRARESMLSDHERLLSVHERQAHEYEQLISQHAALKGKQRALENEHRTMQSKYCGLLQLKEKWEEQERHGQKAKEELKQEVQKNHLLQHENLQLKAEVDRLTANQTQHTAQNEGLHQRINELKSSLSSAQVDASQWMARYDTLMEQHQGLDLTMTKLDNHCELLSRLKGNLEEENHHLLNQINLLSQQNHTLLERSMESKELYHQEQKLYIDKLNSLRRQKEKLEEKIMDQYKFYAPTPKKSRQWSGAKALAKLIKPRKESSRERGGDRDKEANRERESAKSVPDIPLPATPPILPPETPPPISLRAGSDSQSGSNHSNHSISPRPAPALTPISRDLTDRSQSLYHSSTPRSSNESVNGDEALIQRMHLSSTPALQSSSQSFSSTSRLGQGFSRRPRGLSEEDLRHDTPDCVFSPKGYMGGGPGSGHNMSSSESPVACRDTLDRPRRSASLSSEDFTGHSQTPSRSSTLPYDHTPQRAQPQRGGGPRPRARTSSPGSEMVTLEEFLHESNLQSPPVVSTGSREDLMVDYFSRSSSSSMAAGKDQATPTNYVVPTLHLSNQRPGQSVKPSPRQPAGQSLPSNQPVTQRSSQSLSRAFSLASADLLHCNRPDGYRGNDSTPQEAVVRRQERGPNGRERPLSARFSSPTNFQEDDSVLTPAVHHSPSLTLQTERERSSRGRTPTSRNSASSQYHHRGEVAMVTPVRAVSTSQSIQASEPGPTQRDGHAGDAPHSKDRSGSVERPKSTPASPDPNDDPQTVWYEYGCV